MKTILTLLIITSIILTSIITGCNENNLSIEGNAKKQLINELKNCETKYGRNTDSNGRTDIETLDKNVAYCDKTLTEVTKLIEQGCITEDNLTTDTINTINEKKEKKEGEKNYRDEVVGDI
jgi:5-bromo-4-chloroindolyl phosphate hydrolysis protein